MTITLPELTPAQESLFLTLGGRALDSRLPEPFLGDTMADEILGESGYDIVTFPQLTDKRMSPRMRVFDIVVRAKRLDEVVSRFVASHPNAVVLDLGAGLDDRIFRVDPPATVDWYDVDFPEVIGLRRQLLPKHDSVHEIATDLTGPCWLDDVPGDRPAVLVADGLIGFLSQDGFVSLLNRIVEHFSGGELAFNLYTTMSVWALKHLKSLAALSGDVVNPGFNDAHAPERWAPGLGLMEEIFLTRGPEVAAGTRGERLMNGMVAWSATLSRTFGTTVLRYRFPEESSSAPR